MPECKKCESHFSNYTKVNGDWKNLSSRKFCLECSPYGKHNTKDLTKHFIEECPAEKLCSKCKTTKTKDSFYIRYDTSCNKLSSWCKECNTQNVIKRQRVFKDKCVEYKGGACTLCGYNKCPSALEFHHLDPSKKDFNMSRMRNKTFNKRAMIELDKCIIVCRNCHAEIHVGFVQLD